MKWHDAEILVKWISDSRYECNSYEEEFLEHISNRKVDLTYRQGTVLQSIYCRSSGGGNYQKREYV